MSNYQAQLLLSPFLKHVTSLLSYPSFFTVDVIIFGEPISIKSKTGYGFGGIKVSWTVDAEKALNFLVNYEPMCDILLAQIIWGEEGGLFFMPIEAQREILYSVGKEAYLNLPKPGTNPRGIEIYKDPLNEVAHHPLSNTIPIMWKRPKFEHQKYKRWIKYWRTD